MWLILLRIIRYILFEVDFFLGMKSFCRVLIMLVLERLVFWFLGVMSWLRRVWYRFLEDLVDM